MKNLYQQYHQQLPNRIRQWLNDRDITDEIINLHFLGWDGRALTIPIFDRDDNFSFFKYRKDPADMNEDTPKYWYEKGRSAELFGWEHIKRGRSPLIVCEGELDRLTLESKGFASVTSTGGAGTWRQEWFEPIPEDVDVYVCLDYDDAGRLGTKKVTELLQQAKVVTLPPEVGEHGDVTDYFVKLGKTADDFRALLKTAEIIEESRNNKGTAFKPIPLSNLMRKEFKGTEWLVDRLIPAGGLVALSGAPATHKTWLALDIALKVASGDILFDKFPTSQTDVLIVDEENGERLLQTRFRKIAKSFDLPIYLQSWKGFKLTGESVASLIEFAQSKGVKLIIFDSFMRIHTSRDENDAVEMAKVFDLLRKFSKEGIAVVFIHHNRKQYMGRSNPSQDMRGSSDILASVDCHLAVDRKSKDDAITVTQTKLRQDEETKPFKLNIINDDCSLRFEYAGEVDEVQTKKMDFKEAVCNRLGQEVKPMYKKELFESLKKEGIQGGYSTFKMAMQEMVEAGELFERKGTKNMVYCSLAPFEPSEMSENGEVGESG